MLPIELLFAGYKLVQKAFELSDRDAASVDIIDTRTAAAPPAESADTRRYWTEHRSEIVAQTVAAFIHLSLSSGIAPLYERRGASFNSGNQDLRVMSLTTYSLQDIMGG